LNTLIDKIVSCKDIDDAINLFYQYVEKTPTIQKALDATILMHKDQFRKSGEPYVIHPICVATFVAFLRGDEQMVAAALLHDVVEDTRCEISDVEQDFSYDIAGLVESLTKIMEIRDKKLVPSDSDEKLLKSAMSFRKMLIASIKDIRVLVIKLCDRLHNMLTLSALSPDKQKRISEETIVVYAPIAHRLGISSVKNKLEDIAFSYLLPIEYKKIDDYLFAHASQMQEKLNGFTEQVSNLLLRNGFTYNMFTIEKRVKHHYSIYMKMQRKGVSIEEVLDLLAIRILTQNPTDCYKILGVIHLNFKPLVSRYKDYIAMPKENGYQTIHTTVFSDLFIIETQIRTYEMHKIAEFGVAAHWKYKSAENNSKLEWLSELSSTENESNSAEEFYENIKMDLYSEDIAVFSPKGDIFTLPRGANGLDFAYAVHTEVGDRAQSVYVNKQQVPLLTELKNGDIVNVVTADSIIYRCSWIESVATGKAKSSIRANCRNKLIEISTKVSYSLLMTIFDVDRQILQVWLEKEKLIAKLYRVSIDSSYLIKVASMLSEYAKKHKPYFSLLSLDRYVPKKQKKQRFGNIVVYSNYYTGNVIYDFCCHPKRGDDIVAFKKGPDVEVHHKMCQAASLKIDKYEPMVFVKWSKDILNRYKVVASLENKVGALAYFLLFLAKMDVNVLTIKHDSPDDSHTDFFEVEIEYDSKKISALKDKIDKKYKIIQFAPMADAYKQIKGLL
jgi:GTP pyrophosphokinase